MLFQCPHLFYKAIRVDNVHQQILEILPMHFQIVVLLIQGSLSLTNRVHFDNASQRFGLEHFQVLR